MNSKRMTAADVMYGEPYGSFRSWLVRQSERQDAVGDLARDIGADHCLGQKRTPKAILSHIQADHYPSDNAVAAFLVALAEWRKVPA
jgi:hypothetical protein